MDHNQWKRNVLDNRVEQWREQRAQKMAARLQLNSTKPRTISSDVLGYVNYRQPVTLPPGFRQHHGEGPRFNNHGDQRWNPNYNYAGYRDHHSPHKQYHHTADHRNHGYNHGHGSYHHQHQQQYGQKKGGHFSSHKSLYNDRKTTNKPNKRFSSSCSSINKTTEAIQQNVCQTEQASNIASECTVPSLGFDIHLSTPGSSECRETVIADVEGVSRNAQLIEKTSESGVRIQDSSISDRLDESTVVTLQISELEKTIVAEESPLPANETSQICETSVNRLPELQTQVDGCLDSLSAEGDIISDISELESVTNSSDETPTLYVDANSTVAYNEENSNLASAVHDKDILEVDGCVESVSNEEDIFSDISELEPVTNRSDEAPTLFVDAEDISEVTGYVDLMSNEEVIISDISVLEPVTNSSDEAPTLIVDANSTVALNVECSNHASVVDAEDISESPVEVNDHDTNEAVDPLQLNTEVAVDTASCGEINNEEASIIRYEDISTASESDLSKEIERVENKLANITIVNKEEDACQEECVTPMKRERRQVLLDATNILPSSTIKFAVREVRKNDESEIIVTPVRRSARLSVMTPVSAHKNVCVQKLEELSPEVIQKMKFVKNPAIENPPEC